MIVRVNKSAGLPEDPACLRIRFSAEVYTQTLVDPPSTGIAAAMISAVAPLGDARIDLTGIELVDDQCRWRPSRGTGLPACRV